MQSETYFKEERDKIVKGLEEAYRRLIQRKRASNSPVIVSRKGLVVALDPHSVPTTTVYKR
jgi:hypothetical protein